MEIESSLQLGHSLRPTMNLTQGSTPHQNEDVNFFSSQLGPSTRHNIPTSTTGVLDDALRPLEKSTRSMKNSLKAFNSQFNEKARLNYASHLSDTMITTQVLVKSVGKGAQLIDKIGNLQ